MVKFPPYFPDDCPPPSAQYETREGYRWSGNNPPEAIDFLPHVLLYEGKKRYAGRSLVKACGISLYSDRASAARVRSMLPPLRARFVARGTVEPAMGKVSSVDRTGHFTLWAHDAVELHPSFRVV